MQNGQNIPRIRWSREGFATGGAKGAKMQKVAKWAEKWEMSTNEQKVLKWAKSAKISKKC